MTFSIFPSDQFFKLICSDPYVRIDLVTVSGDEVIDSVMTKTKKRVNSG